MKNLSHKEAHILIQRDQRTPAERRALEQHLATCADCRSYYEMDRLLAAHLQVAPVRRRPTAAQREAIVAGSRGLSFAHIFRSTAFELASLAALLALILAGWYFVREFRAAQLNTEPPPATVAATGPAKGRVVTVGVPAPSLAGSLLLDPDGQALSVFLPPSYAVSEKRFPVLYFLPRDESDLVLLRTVLTTAVDNGELDEMIVVSPDFPLPYDSHYRPLFFVNSPVLGNLEDFMVQDVVSFVDATYRTLPTAGSRAIAGRGAGGFSALNVAMHAPDTFGVLYALQPTILATESDLAASSLTSPAIRTAVTALVDRLASLPPEEARAELLETDLTSSVLLTVIYGLSFPADPQAHPPYFDYLYTDPDTKAPPEVWARWLDGTGNLEAKVSAARADLLQMKAIGIASVEKGTQAALSNGVDHLAAALTAAEIPHTTAESVDVGVAFRQHLLPFLDEHLASE